MNQNPVTMAIERALSAGKPWATVTPLDIERHLSAAQIPAAYASEITSGWHATPASRAVSAFLADPKRRLLLLMGKPGTGKTLAICAAAAVAIGGRYVLSAEMSQAYRRLDYRDRVDAWIDQARILAIDELGREPTDADQRSRSTVWEVVERRWANGRKTILASNVTERAFRERYDEPMWDRITGDGGVVVLTGASLRQRGAA